MHLLVFHMYICTKGLTTYEYLKPPVPQLPSPPLTSSPSSRLGGRKSFDSTASVTSSSGGKNFISSSSRGSANVKSGIPGQGVNDGDASQMSEESEAIWTTMTEIDLNAPSDFIGGTLPRSLNGGVGGGGGHYQPEENDMERINNEKNKTLNAMAIAGENYLLRGDVGKGKKKKGKDKSEKKGKSTFSKKWNDLFGSGGSTNKVNPSLGESEGNLP